MPAALTEDELNARVELTDEAWDTEDDGDENRRPLITWGAFARMTAQGKRVHRYDLLFEPRTDGEFPRLFSKLRKDKRMAPDAPLRLRQQATKWLKWYGAGWKPIGYMPANSLPAQPAEEEEPDTPVIFFCKRGAAYGEGLESRHECERFFDSEQGLRKHQVAVHGAADRAL